MSTDPKSDYYDVGRMQTIDIIRAKLSREQFIGFLLGNILKYGCRLNWKGDAIRDCEKVGVYQKMLHEFLKEK